MSGSESKPHSTPLNSHHYKPKTYWELGVGEELEYLMLDAGELILVARAAIESTNEAVRCTFDDFTKGKFQKEIENLFGKKILREVRESVICTK